MLILGKNNERILDHLPPTFLFIDDGDLISKLTLPKLLPRKRKITVLDFKKHFFNPLKNVDHRKARAFAEIAYAASPQGENTLTVRNGKRALARLVLNAKSLDKLPRSKEPENIEANATVDDILFSPVVRRFLTRTTNFPIEGTIIARLDRASLGDFDCFVIANLLMSSYKGHIVVPDYGTYACPFHLSLIRQNRLTVGVHVLDELPPSLQRAFLLTTIIPAHTTFKDAEILANAAGVPEGTNDWNDFIFDAMR